MTDDELDARLREHRCVWCGRPIPDRLGQDCLFDTEDCHHAWQQRTVARNQTGADLNRKGIHVPDFDGGPPPWLGDQSGRNVNRTPIRITQAELDAIPQPAPTEVPALKVDVQPAGNSSAFTSLPTDEGYGDILHLLGYDPALGPVPALGTPPTLLSAEHQAAIGQWTIINGGPVRSAPPLPPGFDYTAPERTGEWPPVYKVRAADLGDPPPITITAEQAVPTSQGTHASATTWIPDLPLLAETDPPPEPATAWPIGAIRGHERCGYRTLVPHLPVQGPMPDGSDLGSPLPPERDCPRCDAREVGVAVTGLWPHIESDRTVLFTIRPVYATNLCCPNCWLPYPGPTLVPMWRPLGASPYLGHTFILVSTLGSWCRRMSQDTIDGPAGGNLGPLVWKGLYGSLAASITVWGCCLPGCSNKAVHWVALAGALSWDGWTWQATDGLPLRMGMCTSHYHRMRVDLRPLQNQRAHLYPSAVTLRTGAARVILP